MQMSGQAPQINQVGGSGIGGADGPPQQMQDVVGLGGLDAQFLMMRNTMRDWIFEYIGRKQSSSGWQQRLPQLAKQLEEILYRKFSNKTDYYNMMMGPVEPQLQFAIKKLSAQNQQSQQNQQGITQGDVERSVMEPQINQVGGSGVDDANELPQQQMQDVVGLGVLDAQFVMMRNTMRDRIFEYIGRKQSSSGWQQWLPQLAKQLEEILYRKFSNKTDYYNMMMGPIEPQLQFAFKALSAWNQQMPRQMASSSGSFIMIPTPGLTQGASGNSRMPDVTDNTGLPSSGATMVPQDADMGTLLPGAMSNGSRRS